MSGRRYRGADVTKRKRKRIIRRYRGRCWICNAKPPTDRLTLDHIWPRALGGPKAEWNLAPACPRCNLKKGSAPPYLPGFTFPA